MYVPLRDPMSPITYVRRALQSDSTMDGLIAFKRGWDRLTREEKDEMLEWAQEEMRAQGIPIRLEGKILYNTDVLGRIGPVRVVITYQ